MVNLTLEELDRADKVDNLWFKLEEANEGNKTSDFVKEEWHIDPSKLVIKRFLGRVTYGSVYRGLYLGQDVSVKLLDWGEDNETKTKQTNLLRKAFKQEMSVWHKLDHHPNISKLIGAVIATSKIKFQCQNVGLPTKVCCVVTEYQPGGTLRAFLRKNKEKKLDFNTVIELAIDLARGLSYLHSKKIVHRDIKAENMLLDKARTLKITDFGVARFEALNEYEMTGFTGTVGYMAPEVLNNKPYNRKCDVYSFGICLWEIYCCETPYNSSKLSFSELTLAIVNQDLRPEIPKCCPSSLAKVMELCWDAEPKKRPEMEEVAFMLQCIDTSVGKGMTPPVQPRGFFCMKA